MGELNDQVDRFLEYFNGWRKGYKIGVFSYITLNLKNDQRLLIAGSLRFYPQVDASKILNFRHESKSITAEIICWELKDDPLKLFDQITDGIISMPNGKCLQMHVEKNDVWSQFNSGNDLTKNNNPRAATLKLMGGDILGLVGSVGGLEDIDCELQTATIPFNGLNDLFWLLDLGWYQLGNPAGLRSELVVRAENLVVLDRDRSMINGEKASIKLIMASNLPKSELKIGIMPWDRSYEGRKSISGDKEDVEWLEEAGVFKGSVEIGVGENPAALVFIREPLKIHA